MTSFSLGQTPHRMTTILSTGADFVATLTRDDGQDWPNDAQVELIIDNLQPWTATIAGATLAWEVDQDEVDAVIATKPQRGKLYYIINGDTRILWGSGPVVTR